MEEDLRVVEGLCRCFRYEQSKLDELDRNNYAEFIQEDEIQAIENLIKRYKELEEMLKERQEDKERIEELEDIKNKAIGHIECCKTTLGNYILSPNETEYLLHLLKGDK